MKELAEEHSMGIQMIGIDHTKANVDIRALFSFTKKNAVTAMEALKEQPGIRGCVILSTCNRMELWVSTQEHWNGALLAALCRLKGVSPDRYAPYFSVRTDREAVDHLFHLVCGLRSMILAEDQIISQVKDALALAREHYVTDNVLEVLFRQAITAGKKVKTDVTFSRANQTAMDQAIEMLKSQGFPFPQANCLVIGNGEMGKLAAQSLKQTGAQVTVTVRQYRSGVVSIPLGCSRINYGDRLACLPTCDLVVSATASPNFTLTTQQIADAGLTRPTIFIDLAVPRDMEPGIAELPMARLYTIDDFKRTSPSQAMTDAMARTEAILKEQIDEFYVWLDGRDLIPRIQEIREEAVTDLHLRLHKLLHKLPLSEEDMAQLEQAIDAAAGKVVTKMIFGLRDTLEKEAFADCVEGLEKLYEQ